jgi:hypothetical protein
MIDRPDWGAPAEPAPLSPKQLANEIATQDGPSQPSSQVPAPAKKSGGVSRQDWSNLYDDRGNALNVVAIKTANGDAVVDDPKTGLPIAIMQEMARSADGLEANLDVLRTTLDARLNELASLGLNRDTVIAGFDKLSAPLRHKFLRTAWHNPHLDIFNLLDKAEPLYTLAEAAEAEAFLRGLRR